MAPCRVLDALEKYSDQRGTFGRMGLQQKMRAIEDVRLHARQRLHSGEGLGQIEEDIVPAPQHQSWGLPALELHGDHVREPPTAASQVLVFVAKKP